MLIPKKIEEYIKTCEISCPDEYYDQKIEYYEFSKDELNTLIALVVQECIDSCNINQLHGTLMAENRIKQHFGIEQ